jgi:hypothetical protein
MDDAGELGRLVDGVAGAQGADDQGGRNGCSAMKLRVRNYFESLSSDFCRGSGKGTGDKIAGATGSADFTG